MQENYYSQIGQDRFIDEFYNKKENGTFLDIGAHDGVSGSNSYFLEKIRNWNGICIEPQLEIFEKLKENRSCININCAVSNYNGETDFTYLDGYSNMLSGITEDYNQSHIQRINHEVYNYGGNIQTYKVNVRSLQNILDENNIYDIDFCSIDTEGTEFKIIQSIDFKKTNIKIFIIENNYSDTQIKDYLENNGYVFYKKLEWDDVFIKKDIL